MNILAFSDAFYIGGFPVKWYAMFYLFAFLACIICIIIKLKYYKKVPSDPFFYFIFIGVPVSIFGGRIWDIITGSTVIGSFEEIFGFVNGQFVGMSGLSIQGGVIFAVLAGCVWFPLHLRRPKYMIRTLNQKVQKISMWVYADAIVPVVLLGQVIGRWGNFFNHELYGPVVTGDLDWLKNFMPDVWKHMHITDSGVFDPSLSPQTLRHPMFLYESFLNFIGLILISVGLEFVKKLKAGTFTAAYFFWYGVVRISLEPFKVGYDTVPYYVVAGLFILASILLFIWCQFISYKHFRNTKLFKKIYYTTLYKTKNFYEKITKSKANKKSALQLLSEMNFTKEDLWYCGR